MGRSFLNTDGYFYFPFGESPNQIRWLLSRLYPSGAPMPTDFSTQIPHYTFSLVAILEIYRRCLLKT